MGPPVAACTTASPLCPTIVVVIMSVRFSNCHKCHHHTVAIFSICQKSDLSLIIKKKLLLCSKTWETNIFQRFTYKNPYYCHTFKWINTCATRKIDKNSKCHIFSPQGFNAILPEIPGKNTMFHFDLLTRDWTHAYRYFSVCKMKLFFITLSQMWGMDQHLLSGYPNEWINHLEMSLCEMPFRTYASICSTGFSE